MFWKHFQLILAYLLGHLNIYVRSIMVLKIMVFDYVHQSPSL